MALGQVTGGVAVKPRWSEARRLRRTRRFDPYYEWAKATDFVHFGKAEWCHVLLGFKTSSDARWFAKEHPRPRSEKTERSATMWVPAMYAAPPAGLEATTFCSVVVRIGSLKDLYSM